MTPFLIIPVLIIIIAVAVFFALGVFRATLPPGTAYEKRVLLSPAELTFYRSLVLSVGAGSVVITKVRIADLVQITRGVTPESRSWWKLFGPISQKHIDFVICETMSMTPLVLIELDDKSHLTEKGQKRDELVNKVIAEAGYPLLRIPVGMHGYDTYALKKLIDQTIKTQSSTRPVAPVDFLSEKAIGSQALALH